MRNRELALRLSALERRLSSPARFVLQPGWQKATVTYDEFRAMASLAYRLRNEDERRPELWPGLCESDEERALLKSVLGKAAAEPEGMARLQSYLVDLMC
jgi:hypothetical protein